MSTQFDRPETRASQSLGQPLRELDRSRVDLPESVPVPSRDASSESLVDNRSNYRARVSTDGNAALLARPRAQRALVPAQRVDRCSTAYVAGEVSALALGGLRLAYAGALKGLGYLGAEEAVAGRNVIKTVFRGPLNIIPAIRNARIYTFEELLRKYGSAEEVVKAATRSNPNLNAVGAQLVAGAGANHVQCGCTR